MNYPRNTSPEHEHTTFPPLAREMRVVYVPGTRKSRPKTIRNSIDAAECFRPLLQETSEVFAVAVLDTKHRLIATSIVARGSLVACPVSAASVFLPVLAMNGCAVIVAHNHPSGDVAPSTADVALTDRLKAAGALLNIPVLDSLVVGTEGWALVADGCSRPWVD